MEAHSFLGHGSTPLINQSPSADAPSYLLAPGSLPPLLAVPLPAAPPSRHSSAPYPPLIPRLHDASSLSDALPRPSLDPDRDPYEATTSSSVPPLAAPTTRRRKRTPALNYALSYGAGVDGSGSPFERPSLRPSPICILVFTGCVRFVGGCGGASSPKNGGHRLLFLAP